MKFQITPEITLTEFRASDKTACVALIGDEAIYRTTLRIPRPYTEEHFEQWLTIVDEATRQFGQTVHFAIRHQEGLIGGIGFEGLVMGHTGELGYWLARTWWGQGIMTAAVGAVCRHAEQQWNLVRITAHVFESNIASARVLQKNGFECEGRLRKYYRKDGALIDSDLYARIR